ATCACSTSARARSRPTRPTRPSTARACGSGSPSWPPARCPTCCCASPCPRPWSRSAARTSRRRWARCRASPPTAPWAAATRPTPTWSEASLALAAAAIDRRDVALRLRTAGGQEATRTLRLSALPEDVDQRRLVQAIGLVPRAFLLPPLVGRVAEDSAAWGVL